MPTAKEIIAKRVTACKKFIEGGEYDVTKRLIQLEQRRGQGAANIIATRNAAKRAASLPKE